MAFILEDPLSAGAASPIAYPYKLAL